MKKPKPSCGVGRRGVVVMFLLAQVLLSSVCFCVSGAEFNTSTTLCSSYASPCSFSDPNIWMNGDAPVTNDTVTIDTSNNDNNTIFYILFSDTITLDALFISSSNRHLWFIMDAGHLTVGSPIQTPEQPLYLGVNGANFTMRNNSSVKTAMSTEFSFFGNGNTLEILDTSTVSAYIFIGAFPYEDTVGGDPYVVMRGTSELRSNALSLGNAYLYDESTLVVPTIGFSLIHNLHVFDDVQYYSDGNAKFSDTITFLSSKTPYIADLELTRNSFAVFANGLQAGTLRYEQEDSFTIYGDLDCFYGFFFTPDADPDSGVIVTLINGTSQIAYMEYADLQVESTNLTIINADVTIGNSSLLSVDATTSLIVVINSSLNVVADLGPITVDEQSVLYTNVVFFSLATTINGLTVLPDGGNITTQSNIQLNQCQLGAGSITITEGGIITCATDLSTSSQRLAELCLQSSEFAKPNRTTVQNLTIFDNSSITSDVHATLLTLSRWTSAPIVNINGNLHLDGLATITETGDSYTNTTAIINITGTLYLSGNSRLEHYLSQSNFTKQYTIAYAAGGINGQFGGLTNLGATHNFALSYSTNSVILSIQPTTPAVTKPTIVWWIWVLIGVVGACVVGAVVYGVWKCRANKSGYTPIQNK